MGLLHPAALLSLIAAVPALVLAYLARERPKRVTVSSVLAFRALRGPRAERFRGRPRFNWMFFVELAILVLAVLALAGPFATTAQKPIAVVLDNSATMQVRMPSGETRFEAIRSKLRAALAAESGATSVSVYVTAPTPHRIGDPFDGIADARSAIGRAELTDAPGDADATARMLGELVSGGRFGNVIYGGNHPLESPVPANVHAIAVGETAPNYAIGSFILRRESLGTETVRARVTIANFSRAAQTLDVAIIGDGHPLGRSEARLEAGEVGSIDFASLAPAQIYRAELKPDDAFPLDNVAYAAAGALKSVSILFVSPTPADAAGLSSLPGVSVRTRLPDQYAPDDLANADLAIFEYAVPKQLPPINAMLVMPPPGDPVFNFAVASSSNVQITGWRTPDPLTDTVNFRLLDIRRGEYFAQHPWMAPVVNGAEGGLVLAGQRESHRFVATGFDPFPYFGKRNLPMSILTLNMLSYLAELSSESRGYRTGEAWLVPAGVTKIVTPAGASIAVEPGTLFSGATSQGVYQLLTAERGKTLRAINLSDLATSDLTNVAPLKIEAAPTPPPAPQSEHRAPLDKYLLAVILALAALEAVGAYRRRAVSTPAQS